MKALRKLKDNTGNYIWNPSVQAGVPDTILNRPYKTSSYVPEIKAGNKCMAFGDFSYYWVADRQGRSFKRLNELFAMTGQVGFLASQRLDGKLILRKQSRHSPLRKRDAMITLKEAKNYLRVDYEEDDSLIQNLLSTAKNLVMDVGRMDESAFAENEDTVRTAMLFALGYLYENRSNPDYKKLTLNLRSILFAQREGVM